jgi:hypothetical protein
MLNFLFGKKKKKRSVKKGKGRKLPAVLLRLCKKYHIKVTRKVGKRRIYKKVSVLKKQLKHKMKNKNKQRRSRFGFDNITNILNIKNLIKQLQDYKDGVGSINSVLIDLNHFLKDKSHFPEISINADAYKNAVHDMARGSPSYLQKQRILGGLIAQLTPYKNCNYSAQDDYDDFEHCDSNKDEVKGLILDLLTIVFGLKKGVDFYVNNTSFGKKKKKVIKLKNNKKIGPKLQGYANGVGLIIIKIKGKVYSKRIKRGTKKGYFKITIKGKNYQCKQKQRAHVTLVALKRKR